jgi:hypothetical protein
MSRQQPSGLRPACTVTLRDESGQEFKIDCHEEPNVLDIQNGYGYFPLTLEQVIHDGKLRIVRKLGWGKNSTVWLAQTRELVPFLISSD